MKFTEFDFDEEILKGVEEAQFTDCTPVQKETFQYALQGRDVFAQSQTGSGKTAAFVLSSFHLMRQPRWPNDRLTLVIAPTRELAVQIEKEAKLLGRYLGFRIGSVYGGVSYNEQKTLLERGVDFLVGTPGRLLDFAESGKVRFSKVGILVIDEADRLFDMGFFPDIQRVLKASPPPGERVTMLFSATLNTKVGNVSWEYMKDPGEVIVSPENVTVETVSQELYHVSSQEKFSLLLGVLLKEKPETAIIFTNTRHVASDLSKRLTHNGLPCLFLSGDLPQKQRLRIVEEVKKGHSSQYLVATDVAARGLHIDKLQMVVNYDVPIEPESYIHRIGRTARAGESGKAVTLACEQFVYGLPAIETLLGKKIPVSWANETLQVSERSPVLPQQHRDRIEKRQKKSLSRRTESHKPSRGDSREREIKDGSRKRILGERAMRAQQQVLEAVGMGKSDKSSPRRIPRETPARRVPRESTPQDSLREQRTFRQKETLTGGPSPRSPQRSNPPKTQQRRGSGKDAAREPSRRGEKVDPSKGLAGKTRKKMDRLEDRVQYYRDKYGESFSLELERERRGSSKSERLPKRRRGNGGEEKPKKVGPKFSDRPRSSRRSPATESKSDEATLGDEKQKKATLRGILGRFFGK